MKHPSGDDHADGGAAPRASAGEGTGAGGDTLRIDPPPVPRGLDRLRWYGPGLLWMLSSVGSGSVLFTPRIGSRYGYELLWIALVVIFLQWAMIREVGRYTVCTGKTFLDGLDGVPALRGWAIWFVFLPQLLAAVVTIAGIAALAGSALMIALPGSQGLYATALVVVAIGLVVSGHYRGVERVSTPLAGLLVAAAVASAVVVFPAPAHFAAGLVPGRPEPFDLEFILPWVGFILAGAAGVIWFSYWVAARGYGGPVMQPDGGGDPDSAEFAPTREERDRRLLGWVGVMDRAALIGVAGGGLVILSFLVLGAEVLRPEGIVPEGIAVAEDLTRLLQDLWGGIGRWILLLGIFVALWGTILANQDGWGRMFADATLILARRRRHADRQGRIGRLLSSRERLKNLYAIVTTAVLPLVVFWLVRRPVDILSVAGIVAAAHTPVIVFLIYFLNRRELPPQLRAGRLMSGALLFAGLFFSAFALLYFGDLLGLLSLGRPETR